MELKRPPLRHYLVVFFLCWLYFGTTAAYSQSFSTQQSQRYWVFFTDKSPNQLLIELPESFLTKRSLDRRQRMGIPIDERDLPPADDYVNVLKDLPGVQITGLSRWFNAAVVNLSDPADTIQIVQLDMVQSISRVEKCTQAPEPIPAIEYRFLPPLPFEEDIYGATAGQVRMLNTDFLHTQGYLGQGMAIALLDGGFRGVDDAESVFGPLTESGRIKDVWNFPDNNDSVFQSSTHGTFVLSTMAVYLPGTFIGTAPMADYYLYRTEVVDSERVVEEDFWVLAAERADAMGVDVINSSLGYTLFDVLDEDHAYEDLDGNTTMVTRGADMAASRGILVVNSAGNEGDDPWMHISAPADADSILAVGAVDPDRIVTAFSGRGPSFDGRIKPDVAAQGSFAAGIGEDGTIREIFGTSFSSPITAGSVACLWQGFPDKSNMDIIDAVRQSGHQASLPDNILGYGIPDMRKAWYLLSGQPITSQHDYESLTLMPNPVTDQAYIYLSGDQFEHLQPFRSTDIRLKVYDAAGRKLNEQVIQLLQEPPYIIDIPGVRLWSPGVYLVELVFDARSATGKLIKN